MAYRPEIEKSKSGQVLVRTCGKKMQASDGKTDPQKQPGALSWGAMCPLQPSTLQADNHKKRTGFGPHLRRENAGQSWQDGSAETARSAFMGSDVLLQPSTLQADNHKKRTGFGPQQASFGVYVSNAFGGMSGALNLEG